MKISTLSIVAGTKACNATCPFCVSKMTPWQEKGNGEVNWRNFDIACRLAVQGGATTAMITGKGEPTLYPEMITQYAEMLQEHKIPLLELQTNGLKLLDFDFRCDGGFLKRWYRLGMTTIAVSVVHWKMEENTKIYCKNDTYPTDLGKFVKCLHGFGFSVRLSCIMLKGFIDNQETCEQMVNYARNNDVDQLTFMPLNYPKATQDESVRQWVIDHYIERNGDNSLRQVREWLASEGTPLMTLPHGATVYDVHGQNVCLNHCLADTAIKDEIRNLIFYPDGRIAYDWQYTGAVVL